MAKKLALGIDTSPEQMYRWTEVIGPHRMAALGVSSMPIAKDAVITSGI
ncbi:MAG: hypothetical protein OXH91_04270 [Chloroflexota bacterium]|nr:hypothetical protein [Chloroflexota bacterium]